jgi:hypothetical protein
MKTIAHLAVLTVALGLVSAATANAAGTASSAVSAEIINAISISNTTGLQFGEIVASATAGTVVVSTASVRTGSGGVVLDSTIPVSASSFAVTGDPTSAYSITLPSSITLTAGANTMTVDSFVSNPTVAAGGMLSAGGTQTLLVGASLHVGVSQAVAVYSGTYNVTVVYN